MTSTPPWMRQAQPWWSLTFIPTGTRIACNIVVQTRPCTILTIPVTRCGPCKAILPKILEFQEEYEGQVLFYKFNCNKNNKELGQKLGIKVAPTFQLYKQGAKVAEVTGAKADVLRQLIEQHK